MYLIRELSFLGRLLKNPKYHKMLVRRHVLPFDILTLKQCLYCFNELRTCIDDIAFLIDNTVADIQYSEAINESVTKKDFYDIEKQIKLRAARISSLSIKINNYLANGTTGVEGKDKIKPNISYALELVNEDVKMVDDRVETYNRHKTICDFSLEGVYKTFYNTVLTFNSCIHNWNIKFTLRFPYAHLPKWM